jgi:putative cardiolipin synthase
VWRFLWLASLIVITACARPDPEREARAGGLARHAHAQLYLSASGPADDAPAFRFSGLDAGRRSIAVYSVARGSLAVRGHCDGSMLLRQQDGARRIAAGEDFAFTLGHLERGEVWLEPAAETAACELRVTPGRGAAYSIRLEREDLAASALTRLDARREVCALPDSARLDALERAFYAPRALSQTCVLAPGVPRLLGNAREAFNAKVEALTGARLSDTALDAGDPTAPLDFSRAPKLDLIWLSYLNMRADYSGYMIARMLDYHAARGTTVRIMVTNILMLPRDRAIYEDLAARYPNVQLQYYQWLPNGVPAPADPFSTLHRDQHVKVFATLARDAARSRVLIGGRNLHDPFVFDTPRDLSAFPFLRSYDTSRQLTLSFFLAYEDFEIEFSDDASVRAMVAQLSSFWHRDYDTQRMRSPAQTTNGGTARGGMRHFISIPFTDGRAQEQLFVDLIDAAERQIVLTAPFLNLPPALDGAFRRARARGVEVVIVARTVIEEPAGMVSQALNRMFFEDYAGLFTIIGFDPMPRTLHTKIMVIDARLALVTSTNVNQRSFLHDTENGVMILDTTISARLLAVIDSYRRRGVPVVAGMEVPPLIRALMAWPALRAAF